MTWHLQRKMNHCTFLLLLAILVLADCFSPNQTRVKAPLVKLRMESESGLTARRVKKQIDALSTANFASTIDKIEPYLKNDAGFTFYTKAIHRIKMKSKSLGQVLPAEFAREAKATTKRREKQNAFIAKKESERMASEEAAAAAAAAQTGVSE
jgi:hypothetical protein